MRVEISRSVVRAITDDAAASPEVEVCGVLFGSGGLISAHLPCRNVAQEPRGSFEIDPAALIAAHRAERAGGARIAGCYHSHPLGPASPSPRDAAAAEANGWIWLIAGSDGIAAFRVRKSGVLHDRFDPVALTVV